MSLTGLTGVIDPSLASKVGAIHYPPCWLGGASLLDSHQRGKHQEGKNTPKIETNRIKTDTSLIILTFEIYHAIYARQYKALWVKRFGKPQQNSDERGIEFNEAQRQSLARAAGAGPWRDIDGPFLGGAYAFSPSSLGLEARIRAAQEHHYARLG